jgi:hypothetical protein
MSFHQPAKIETEHKAVVNEAVMNETVILSAAKDPCIYLCGYLSSPI